MREPVAGRDAEDDGVAVVVGSKSASEGVAAWLSLCGAQEVRLDDDDEDDNVESGC
jgi:hypothetical protein